MFSSVLHTFGLDISDCAAKCIAVHAGFRGELEISSFGRCEIPEGAIADGELIKKDAIAQSLAQLLAQIPEVTRDYVVLSLPESKTFIKVIEVQKGETPTLDGIIAELPNHIPTPLEDLIIDWQITQEFEGRIMVTVGAVPKTVTAQYVELLEQLHLKPFAFEVEAQAIVRSILAPAPAVSEGARIRKATKFFSKNSAPAIAAASVPAAAAKLIVDLGASRTSFILYDWDTIQFTSSISASGTEATRQVAERLKLTPEEAERAKKICGLDSKKCKGVVSGVLEGMLGKLAVEIERAIEFYGTHFHRARGIDEIILTGGGASLLGAEQFLASQLSVPVRLGNPLQNVSMRKAGGQFPKRDALSYTTAIGLALRQFAHHARNT